jgi:O-antigen ligase
LEAIIACLQPQHLGTVYRTFRLAEYVAGLWLLSPWWGRRDMLLVRCHMASLAVVQGTVILGLLVAPGHALAGHRLGGVLWGIPATEVAHYAAVTAGVAVVLWFGGMLPGRATLLITVAEGLVLVLTHTRTALIALVVGIIAAGLSLSVARVRVRRFFVAAGVIVLVVAAVGAGVLTTWLARGQSTQELTSLTGRTDFWSLVLNLPRTRFQEIFGFGLSNASFNGFPIDSNWLSSYQQEGLFGVVTCAIILLFLLVTAYFQEHGVRRALALFLITYALVASFTEDGFTDVSPYLLDLTLAASLLVPSLESSGLT